MWRYSGGREVSTSYATSSGCNLFTNHGTNIFEFVQNGIKFQGSTCDEAKKKANLQSPVKEVFGGTSTPDLIVNSIKNLVAPPPQKKQQSSSSLPSRFEGVKIPKVEEVLGGTSTPDLEVHSQEVFGGKSTPDLIVNSIKNITKPIQDLVSNVTGGGGGINNAVSSFGLPPTIFNIQTPIVLGALGAILLVILLIKR